MCGRQNYTLVLLFHLLSGVFPINGKITDVFQLGLQVLIGINKVQKSLIDLILLL